MRCVGEVPRRILGPGRSCGRQPPLRVDGDEERGRRSSHSLPHRSTAPPPRPPPVAPMDGQQWWPSRRPDRQGVRFGGHERLPPGYRGPFVRHPVLSGVQRSCRLLSGRCADTGGLAGGCGREPKDLCRRTHAPVVGDNDTKVVGHQLCGGEVDGVETPEDRTELASQRCGIVERFGVEVDLMQRGKTSARLGDSRRATGQDGPDNLDTSQGAGEEVVALMTAKVLGEGFRLGLPLHELHEGGRVEIDLQRS